jgi:hypothetical protein
VWTAWSVCDLPPDACQQPALTVDLAPGQVQWVVDTRGAASHYTERCANAQGPEAGVAVRVDRPLHVTFEVTSAGHDTVLAVRSACADPSTEVACDDDGGAMLLSRVTVNLAPGTWWLLVDGFGAGVGSAVTIAVTAEDAGPCVEGAAETRPCDGGTQGRRCLEGAWSEWSACVPARCAPASSAQCRDCTDAMEPDDTIAQAVPVAIGSTYAGLTTCPDLDRDDWFSVRIDVPSLLKVHADAEPGSPYIGSPDIEVIGAPGRLTGINEVGGDDSFAFDTFVDQPGTYYVHVSTPAFQDTRRRYALFLEATPGPACEWTNGAAGCVQCVDRLDPDDTAATARTIRLGDSFADLGVCGGLDPEDWYTFQVDQVRTVAIDVTERTTVGRLSVFLDDSAGHLVQTQNTFWVDGRTTYSAPLAPGRYLIEVRADPGVAAYDLTLRAQ